MCKLQAVSFRLDEESGVAVACHNTPKNLHALTLCQQMEYFVILEHCTRCDDVKCVLWTATGDKAFGSGAALRGGIDIAVPADVVTQYDARGMAPDFGSPPDVALKRQTLLFWDFPKPCLVAVNGLAVGGHANFALANHFDVVFASTNAKFKYPFASLGLTPELGSSFVMPFVLGMARAKQIMLGGDWFQAQQAREWGLVNEVHELADLFPKALEYAKKLAATNPTAVSLGKRLLNHHLRKHMDEVMDIENETQRESLGWKEEGGALLEAQKKRNSDSGAIESLSRRSSSRTNAKRR